MSQLPFADQQHFTSAELQAAANLVRQAAQFPDHEWLQGPRAVDAQGQPVAPDSPAAVQFCACGLLQRQMAQAPFISHIRPVMPAITLCVPPEVPYRSLGKWNDAKGRRPEEVRELFRQAAELLEDQAQREREMESRDESPALAV